MVVPASTSLAAQVSRNEEASREENSIIKARVRWFSVGFSLNLCQFSFELPSVVGVALLYGPRGSKSFGLVMYFSSHSL